MASTKFFFWSWVFQSSNIYMSNHELRMVSRPNVTPCARRSQLHGRHELCWGYLFCCLFAKIYISVKRLFSDLEALIPCFRILYIRVYIYTNMYVYIYRDIYRDILYTHAHILYYCILILFSYLFFQQMQNPTPYVFQNLKKVDAWDLHSGTCLIVNLSNAGFLVWQYAISVAS